MTLEQYETKVASVIVNGVAEIVANSIAKGDEDESKLFIWGLGVVKAMGVIRSNLYMGRSEVEPDEINMELDNALEKYVEVMEDAPDNFLKDLGVVLADIFERAKVRA